MRYGDNFAPKCGTYLAHKKLLDKFGFVWYGKFGNAISQSKITQILNQDKPRILLVKSGTFERYWCFIDKVSKETPPAKYFPKYYRDMTDQVGCWFRITDIKVAEKNVMSKCTVVSSDMPLNVVSKVSMNPCLFVDYNE